MHFKILTIFPQLFPGALAASITGLALEKKLWSFEAINIRNYAKDKHQTVDDAPYGGGAGMLLKADVLGDAIENNNCKKIIYLSPRGKIFTQKIARELALEKEITILCGRYEGVDSRVLDEYEIEEISIGDYVLSGGEIAAQVLIDAVLRNVDGVLGGDESLNEESFGAKNSDEYHNLLEYPHYTRPSVWKGRGVPEILTTGHHKNIEKWRKEEAIKITQKNRPDLYQKFIEGENKS
jgi:tRNA (guanine37-N1)-methyltransferase